MLACLDVSHGGSGAVAACLLFRGWGDAVEERALTAHIAEVAPIPTLLRRVDRLCRDAGAAG